tara:strand:+ start:344 stop:1288 length:945 start_codon:yes stop_codon:yes gene_type:complete
MSITLPVPGGGGATPQPNYYVNTPQFGEYQFVSLSEIINNFVATYIGEGKILENTLRGDVHFHAHRALQELHYDTLKSCKSLEVEVCSSLRVPLPHDYVNYTKITMVGQGGIEQVLYPMRHTSNPKTIEQTGTCTDDGDTADTYTFPDGFDSCGTIAPTSSTWDAFSGGNGVLGGSSTSSNNHSHSHGHDDIFSTRFGLQPEHAQTNGSFFIDCNTGMVYLSSNVAGKKIIIHYLSDGHGTTDEAMVPKLAEEAMYKWIAYGCASARVDVGEGVIQRLKKERFAETRKAKIRLSNIKIEEITQLMRNRSKWIKH